jgi:hypothetical protein
MLNVHRFWTQTIENFSKSLPSEWQVVQLAYVKEKPNDQHSKLSFSQSTHWGTQAYLISKNGMKRIIREFFYLSRNKFDLK